jgi:hypothetical protein
MPRRASISLLSLVSRPLFAVGLACAALALPACSPSGDTPYSRLAQLESEPSEALLRHVYENCPMKAEVKVAALALTAEHLEPSAAFKARFANLGPRLISYREIQAVKLADIIRIVEAKPDATGTRALVLLLQVASIAKAPDGSLEAVAAWAFKDSKERRKYILKPKDGGGYEITADEVLESK